MKVRSMSLAVVAAALFSSSIVLAADPAKPAADQPAAAASKASPSGADASKLKAKAKKPKVKPIDINNASAEELKKIPGVGDAEAERIIKARPYPTRAYLVERNVVTLEQYYAMKDYMVAVQPDPKASKSSKAAKK